MRATTNIHTRMTGDRFKKSRWVFWVIGLWLLIGLLLKIFGKGDFYHNWFKMLAYGSIFVAIGLVAWPFPAVSILMIVVGGLTIWDAVRSQNQP